MLKPSEKRKGGPVEIVESKGVKVPIYLTPAFGKESFTIAFYADGKRVRERAPTLAAAREQAKAKIRELTTGMAHAASFTPRQTAVVADAVEILREINVPLSDAVRQFAEAHKILAGQGTVVDACRFYLEQTSRRQIPRKNFPEVVTEFLLTLESKGLSSFYKRDSRIRLGRAALAFRGVIMDISSADIEAWIAQGKRSPRTINNDRDALVTLFGFAKKRGYLPKDIDTAAELTEKRKDKGGDIQILTPENYTLLLNYTPNPFLPLVALGGLAGLRTAEIARLEWNEINFREKHITVAAGKAKTGSRRIVPILPRLEALLRPLAKHDGKVLPYQNEQSMMNQWSRAKARMLDDQGKLLVEVPTNSLRHSFASYRLAVVKSAEQTALEMGNSPRKLFTNYRELVTARQAEKWFAVIPTPHRGASKRRKTI